MQAGCGTDVDHCALLAFSPTALSNRLRLQGWLAGATRDGLRQIGGMTDENLNCADQFAAC